MNVGDMLRNTNSWHWLAAVVVLSAACSVFVPKYGWKAVFDYRRTMLSPQVEKQAKRLAELEALCEDDAVVAQRQADESRKKTAKAREEFAAYGFEPVPAGEEAVFAAQGRVSAALAKRRIRIVSSDASVGLTPPLPAIAVPRSRAGENARNVRNPVPDAGRRGPQVVAPFKTAEIDYRASGDFRDIFMFFVGETHVRANYAFKDISAVSRGDEGMDLAFTLEVRHR